MASPSLLGWRRWRGRGRICPCDPAEQPRSREELSPAPASLLAAQPAVGNGAAGSALCCTRGLRLRFPSLGGSRGTLVCGRGPAAPATQGEHPWGASRAGLLLPTQSLPRCLFVYLAGCCFQAEGEYLKGNCLKAVERIHIYGKKKKKPQTLLPKPPPTCFFKSPISIPRVNTPI